MAGNRREESSVAKFLEDARILVSDSERHQ